MIDDKNITLLMYSATKGYFNLFTYLNSNIDTKKSILTKDRKTIMHCAALGGNKDILYALLGNIIDMEAKDIYGCTPLHLAAFNNHIEIIKLLLQQKTNIEATDIIDQLKSSNQALKDKLQNLELIVKKLIKTSLIVENEQEITNSDKTKCKM